MHWLSSINSLSDDTSKLLLDIQSLFYSKRRPLNRHPRLSLKCAVKIIFKRRNFIFFKMLIQQHHSVWMPKSQIVSSSSSSSSWWQHQLITTTCDVKIIASASKMKMQIVSQNENFLCCNEKKCKKIRFVSKSRILGKSHFSPSIQFHTTFSRLKSELFDFTRRLFFSMTNGRLSLHKRKTVETRVWWNIQFPQIFTWILAFILHKLKWSTVIVCEPGRDYRLLSN